MLTNATSLATSNACDDNLAVEYENISERFSSISPIQRSYNEHICTTVL